MFIFFLHFSAILVDGGVEVDRNVILPISLSIHMSRKVFNSPGDGIPTLVVYGSLDSVRVSYFG